MSTTEEQSPDQPRGRAKSLGKGLAKGRSKRGTDRLKKVTDVALAMRSGQWKGPKAYARATGVSVAQAEQISSEAGRTLTLIEDQDGFRAKLIAVGNEAIDVARGNPHEVAKLLEPVAKIAGIIQPAGGTTINIALIDRAKAAAPVALGALQTQDRPAAIRAGLVELGVSEDALDAIAAEVVAALEPLPAIRGALERAGLADESLDAVATHLVACVGRADAAFGDRIGQAMSAAPSVVAVKQLKAGR